LTKADLHVHTCYSHDSNTSLAEVAESCRQAGINCVAVTDHNCIEGALRLRDLNLLQVIVGEEIYTSDGELIGLFLEHPIPRGLSPLETIQRVREQGGLVCIPHPLGRRPFPSGNSLGTITAGRYTPSRAVLSRNALLTTEVLEQVDMMEVMNARTIFRNNRIACGQLASMCDLVSSAGSDAHTAGEIGRSSARIADFSDGQGFLAAMQHAELSGVRSSIFVHLASTYAKLGKRSC